MAPLLSKPLLFFLGLSGLHLGWGKLWSSELLHGDTVQCQGLAAALAHLCGAAGRLPPHHPLGPGATNLVQFQWGHHGISMAPQKAPQTATVHCAATSLFTKCFTHIYPFA